MQFPFFHCSGRTLGTTERARKVNPSFLVIYLFQSSFFLFTSQGNTTFNLFFLSSDVLSLFSPPPPQIPPLFFLQFPPCFMALRGFKTCSICLRKISLMDGHDQCLFCLREYHQTQLCTACRSLSKQAIKLWFQRLRSFLYEKTLNTNMEVPSLPSPNPPRPEATKTAPSPVEQPLSSTTSLLTKSKNSHKPPKPASTKVQAQSDDPTKKKKDKEKAKRQKKTATPTYCTSSHSSYISGGFFKGRHWAFGQSGSYHSSSPNISCNSKHVSKLGLIWG